MEDPPVDVLSDIDALLSKLKHLSQGARINALSKLKECIGEINSSSQDQVEEEKEEEICCTTQESIPVAKKVTRKEKSKPHQEEEEEEERGESKNEETKEVLDDGKVKIEKVLPKKLEDKVTKVRNSKRRSSTLPHWFNNFSDVPQFLTVQHKTSSKPQTECIATKDCSIVLERTLINENTTTLNINDENKDVSVTEVQKENDALLKNNDETKGRRRRKKNSSNDKEDPDEGKTCNICQRTYINASYLRVHMRQHTGEKPYSCDLCNRKFTQKSSLWVHKKRHEGKFEHQCSECDYKSVLKIDLMRHMPKHTGARVFICDQCGKMFTTDMRLKDHIRHVHVRAETHVCDKCGFSTHRADNLRRHMAVKHSDDELFKCPVCGDMLKQRWTFIVHLRRHTGERPHKCAECGKGFKSLSQLAVHRRTHREGEHCCDDCGRKFKTKHHLLRHTVIHSGLKPFACSYCSYTCNVKGNINKHMKAVHKLANFSFKTANKNQNSETTNTVDEQSAIVRGQQVTKDFLQRISLRKDEQLTVEALQQQLPKPNDTVEEPVIANRRYRARDKKETAKENVENCTIVDGIPEVGNETLVATNAISLPVNDHESNSMQIDENVQNKANDANDLLLLSVKQCLGDQLATGLVDANGQNTLMTLPVHSSQLPTADNADGSGQSMIYVIRVVP